MPAPTLEDLRRQLKEKFPQAHGHSSLPKERPEVTERPFEIACFPAGAISEIVPSAGACGISLWIAGLLGEPDKAPEFPKFILVDGGDGFDPASHSAAACSQLLWIRCRKILEVLKAADLVVRDANVPFVMLDLCSLPVASLRGIPASSWWRLKQLCETGACRLIVLSPSPLVPCASLRLTLTSSLSLRDFDLPRQEILDRISALPKRLRHAT